MEQMTIKIKTVSMNKKGEIEIPADMRKDLKLNEKEHIVLIERGNQIILRKENTAVQKSPDEDSAWEQFSIESLRRAWGKEDEIWDKIYRESKK